MTLPSIVPALALVCTVLAHAVAQSPVPGSSRDTATSGGAVARNVILFVGDGMGISTLTAARIHAAGVGGSLTIDQLPYTALSRTHTGDYITPDSAGTMTSMVTGRKGNFGVISMDESTEQADFNRDGDGSKVTTLLELAKSAGKRVGIVTTDDISGATPACCYAHVNDRARKSEIMLQALPTDATFNRALGSGIDLLVGGGRGYCVPDSVLDEEGAPGFRSDGRDLRIEFQLAGYSYVWNRTQWYSVPRPQLPLIALFDQGPLDYEHDRALDVGGNPSLSGLVFGALQLLATHPQGYVLVVEGGRIDHAHHANNAYRAITETQQLDLAVNIAVTSVNLSDTLVIVTADHGHVFHIAGYPLRPRAELPYRTRPPLGDTLYGPPGDLFSVSFFVDVGSGFTQRATDANGRPYTFLGYGNGPGHRPGGRTDPFLDRTPGFGGVAVFSPTDPNYLQEAGIPLPAETHSGEDVAVHAIGAGADRVRGTVDNTQIFHWIRAALGL